MLELDRVSRAFPGGARVEDLRLTVGAGEVVALIGLNGAGKTTLMRLALGLLRPDSGQVHIDGLPLPRVPAADRARIGHLIEVPFAYPELTVAANLDLAARLRHADPARAREAIRRWRLDGIADRRVRRISLGNRQRVGLAAALQHAPRLAVLDEPGNSLDPAGVLILRDALLERAAAGAAILISSHHLDEVARIANRIVIMNAGRLIGDLDPAGHDLEHAFFERIHADDQERLQTGAGR